eukprot:m.35928 g.35928  ORF g.35928 m.35928 type:complete len:490 (+) comp12822_c0_seq1:158-1627(+)
MEATTGQPSTEAGLMDECGAAVLAPIKAEHADADTALLQQPDVAAPTAAAAAPRVDAAAESSGYEGQSPQQQHESLEYPHQEMMYPPTLRIMYVLDQIFSSLAYGIDLVGISAHCSIHGFIPVPALATIPAISEACQVPGALMSAIQRSNFIELDPTQTMIRAVLPTMVQAPMHSTDRAMVPPHGMPMQMPMQHAPPMGVPYDGISQGVAMGGMPPQQWQGGVQYYMASPGGPAIPPGMPPYGSGMYDEGPRGVGVAAGMDPLRPTSAPTPAERRSSRSSSIDRQAYRTGSFGKSNRGSRKSRHSSHSSGGGAAADDEEGDPLSDAITTKLWLKIIRLHKYTPMLEMYTRRELLAMTDDEFSQHSITSGAFRKLRIELARWATAQDLQVPFTIPPSASPSREGSRSSSRSSSRNNSLPGSKDGSFSKMERPLIVRGANGVQVMLQHTAARLQSMRLVEDEVSGDLSKAPGTSVPADAPITTEKSGGPHA